MCISRGREEKATDNGNNNLKEPKTRYGVWQTTSPDELI